MKKLIITFIVIVATLWSCTILIATGNANMHLDDSPNVRSDQTSQVGRELEKLGDKVDEIDNTVEKTNTRVKQVRETVNNVDSTLVKTIKK